MFSFYFFIYYFYFFPVSVSPSPCPSHQFPSSRRRRTSINGVMRLLSSLPSFPLISPLILHYFPLSCPSLPSFSHPCPPIPFLFPSHSLLPYFTSPHLPSLSLFDFLVQSLLLLNFSLLYSFFPSCSAPLCVLLCRPLLLLPSLLPFLSSAGVKGDYFCCLQCVFKIQCL